MDPISHAVFWGTITHALFGSRYGKGITLFWTVVAMTPDLDMLVRYIPNINPLWAEFFHRTMTHSIPFTILVAPLLGRIVAQTKRWKQFLWSKWALIILVALISHILLDWVTTYGIWLLWPFVDVGFEANIMSVIDLFFTLPLWLLLLIYLFLCKNNISKKSRVSRIHRIGIWYAAVYLGGMATIQYSLKHAMAYDMQQANIEYTRLFASPQILQPFLWYGMVELPDGSYKVTYTSIFDTQPRTYQSVYWYHDELATTARKNNRVAQLIRRSHGRYKGDIQWWIQYFIDLRFGKLLWWEENLPNTYTFTYIIWDTMVPYQIAQAPNMPLIDVWKRYWQRVRGN